MSYKEKVENLVNLYNGTLEVHQAEVRSLLEEGVKDIQRTKKEALIQELKAQIAQMSEHFQEQAVNLNNQAQVMVEGIRADVLSGEDTSQSTDHATKVANAIEFIKLEGEEIDDEAAYSILKDFRNDLDTMQLFKRVIGRKADLENANGTSNFPKTFGKLNQSNYVLNVIEEMEGISAYLFEEPLDGSSETYRIYDNIFSVPGTKTFRQVQGEGMIVNLAQELDDHDE